MKKRYYLVGLILVVGSIALVIGNAVLSKRSAVDDIIDLLDRDRDVVFLFAELTKIETNWHPRNPVMLMECIPHLRRRDDVQNVFNLLRHRTGQVFDDDPGPWYEWVWRQPYNPHPHYADFKARLYQREDPRFPEYFEDAASATIRLDEILWGGVMRDGRADMARPSLG